MDLLHFEDFTPGSVREFGAYRVTRDEIVAFASQFDPQPFHLNEKAGAASLLGGLAASGWHTLAIMMRLYCDDWALRSTSMGSPGIEEVCWLKPVRPDDRLSVRMRIEDARPSRSRPDMGLLTISTEVLNQTRAVVASTRHINMLGRRDRTPPPVSADENRRPRESAAEAQSTSKPEIGSHKPPFGAFESVVIGARTPLGSYSFRKDEMLAFARAYDPQPFHVDEEAAARTHFKHLAASGWLVAGAFMRCLVDTKKRFEEEARAQGRTPFQTGPSPGFKDLRWLKPVHAGDVLAFSSTPIGKRTTSRPGWGLVFAHNVGENQNGAKVYEYTSAVFAPIMGRA